ncbi:MAG: pyruvate kinase, partial [Myxococcota bacterium]
MRRAKIVATLGPSSNTPEKIEALVKAGMNVCRLNFSHGTHEQHREVYGYIRAVEEKLRTHVAVLQDLPGPKIRCAQMKPGVVLQEGQPFSLFVGNQEGDEQRAFTTYETLAEDVKPGERILIDDGKLVLRAEQVEPERKVVHCKVMLGGELLGRKGINLPESNLSIPSFTDEDRKHLRFGLELGVDFVALSFVRDAGDIHRIKEAIAESGRQVPVIAKIEKPEAMKNIEDILEATDGVMVARGDLAVEMSTEDVPVLQKQLI